MITLLVTSAALAGPAGGFRIPGEDAPVLGELRVAAVVNPGDEQVLGAFAHVELATEKVAIGVTSGYTTALYGGEAVDGGLGMTSGHLGWILRDDRGWVSRLGVEAGFAPTGSRAFATVPSESTGGTLLLGVAQSSHGTDKGEISLRGTAGFYQSAALEAAGSDGSIYVAGGLYGARNLSDRWSLGGEVEVLPLEKSWAQLRPLARFTPMDGVALTMGLQIPVFFTYQAQPTSSGTLIFKVSAWLPG